MSRALVMLALAAGCNPAFDIHETDLIPDARPPPDGDGDDVPDEVDNCPLLANDQSDEDEDGAGDVCDNCPLVANPGQEVRGDADPVGDHCDSRPETSGDCLVLFDSFSSPDDFDANWSLQFTSTPPTIEPMPGYVVLPAHASPYTIIARDAAGTPLTGVHDVQLAARGAVLTGSLSVVSVASSPGYGFACTVAHNVALDRTTLLALSVGTTMSITGTDLSADSTSPQGLIRLVAPTVAETTVRCRVDLGSAAGTGSVQRTSSSEPPASGGPGVRVRDDRFEVTAIAIYQFVGAACPPTLYR